MEILVDNRQNEVEIDTRSIELLAGFVLKAEHVHESVELSVVFVEPEEIKELNSRFRGLDIATDVLAFSMLEDTGEIVNPDKLYPLLLGDIIICPHIAAQQAEMEGHTIEEENAVLVIHGILHLLGYDHDVMRDQKRMKVREQELFERFYKER